MKTLNFSTDIEEFEVEYTMPSRRVMFGSDADGNRGQARMEYDIIIHRMIDENNIEHDFTKHYDQITQEILKQY